MIIKSTQNNKFKTVLSISYVISAALFFTLKINDVDDRALISFSMVVIAILFSATIYWYLQIESVSHSISMQEQEKNKRSALWLINEIKDSINLYSLELRENALGDADLLQLDIHISKRIKELNNQGFNFDFYQETLTNNVRLTLFLQSLDKEIMKIESELPISVFPIAPNSENISSSDPKSASGNIESIKKLIEQTTQRINFEIQLERRRSTIYIMFGSMITMVAGYVLYDTVQHIINIQAPTDSVDIKTLIIRFSIVIFIEIFAFYYLRLYSRISDNIKFYQNEMTNVEMKSLCFYALKTEEITDEAKTAILVELSKTERNFVIDKNKTTVDLERSKLDSNMIKSTISDIAKITRNLKN